MQHLVFHRFLQESTSQAHRKGRHSPGGVRECGSLCWCLLGRWLRNGLLGAAFCSRIHIPPPHGIHKLPCLGRSHLACETERAVAYPRKNARQPPFCFIVSIALQLFLHALFWTLSTLYQTITNTGAQNHLSSITLTLKLPHGMRGDDTHLPCWKSPGSRPAHCLATPLP